MRVSNDLMRFLLLTGAALAAFGVALAAARSENGVARGALVPAACCIYVIF